MGIQWSEGGKRSDAKVEKGVSHGGKWVSFVSHQVSQTVHRHSISFPRRQSNVLANKFKVCSAFLTGNFDWIHCVSHNSDRGFFERPTIAIASECLTTFRTK